MKPRITHLTGAVLAAATVIWACNDTSSGNGTGPTPVPTSITLNQTAITLNAIDATSQITATVLDQNGNTMTGQTVTWTSNAAGVASVSGTGLVTAEVNARSLGAFGLPLYFDAKVMAAPGLEPLGFDTEDYPPAATLAGARLRAGWGWLRRHTVQTQQVRTDRRVHDEVEVIRAHAPARVGQALYLGADQYLGYDYLALAIG